MKTFRLKVDAVLEADDVVEALEKIATHFRNRAEGLDSDLFSSPSTFDLRVVGERR